MQNLNIVIKLCEDNYIKVKIPFSKKLLIKDDETIFFLIKSGFGLITL